MEEPSLVRQVLAPDEARAKSTGERRGFGLVPWGWSELLLVSLVVLLVNVVVVVSLARAEPLEAFSWRVSGPLIPLAASCVLTLAAIWTLGTGRYESPWEALGFRPLDLRSLGGLLGLLMVMIAFAGVAIAAAGAPWPQSSFSLGHGRAEVAAVSLLVVVVAPLTEEIFFRGFLLQGLMRRLRFWPAAIVTSIPFALVHIWWELYVPIFVLGLALAWLFWRTGSLWSSIALHVVVNAWAVAFLLAPGLYN